MAASTFLSPAWLIAARGLTTTVVDLSTGESFEVSGRLAEQLSARDRSAQKTLSGMAVLDPTVARFAEAHAQHDPVPLTRARLLAGTGFSQLFVELTARCNERCVHCYADSSPERTEELPLALVEQVLADARALGFRAVQLTGGDPLISATCSAAARRARALGFAIEVYTNGLALTERLYRELKEARVGFAFSFYSADAAAHDAMTRTPGSQARTLESIRKAVADGLDVRASIIVSTRNAHTVEETRALLRGIGVPEGRIGIDYERGVGRGTFTEESASVPVAGVHAGGALATFAGKASVSADGTVYPCIFSRKLPLGNVHTASLRDILSDETTVESDGGLAEAQHLAREMTCWDCRVRNALLARPARLVQLRARSARV